MMGKIGDLIKSEHGAGTLYCMECAKKTVYGLCVINLFLTLFASYMDKGQPSFNNAFFSS